MHIAYSSDQNYVPFLATSIYSVCDNNKIHKITFHILANNISFDSKVLLKNIVEKHSHNIEFYDLNLVNESLPTNLIYSISIAAYSRLFLTELLGTDIKKVIYLDCDTIVLHDLSELWEETLDCSALAVKDGVLPHFKTTIGLHIDSDYINSGVMVLNLAKLRKFYFVAKVQELLSSLKSEFPHHDQGIINKLLHDDIKYLHPKFNVMTPNYFLSSNNYCRLFQLKNYYSDKDLKEARQDPYVVHFTEFYIERPWIENSKHPMKSEFSDYLKMNFPNFIFKKSNKKLKNIFISSLFNWLPFSIFFNFIKAISK